MITSGLNQGRRHGFLSGGVGFPVFVLMGRGVFSHTPGFFSCARRKTSARSAAKAAVYLIVHKFCIVHKNQAAVT